MKNAVIGVVQDDGRILAARVANGGRNLAGMLDRHYATRLRATMLVSLGEITTVGATPARCTIPIEQGEPAIVDPCGFEAMGGPGYHLLEHSGSWIHWSVQPESTPSFAIEE